MNDNHLSLPEIEITPRRQQALDAYLRTGSYQRAADELGCRKQNIYQLVNPTYSHSKEEKPPVYYQDTGCPDGRFPKCLSCSIPLSKCPFQ